MDGFGLTHLLDLHLAAPELPGARIQFSDDMEDWRDYCLDCAWIYRDFLSKGYDDLSEPIYV